MRKSAGFRKRSSVRGRPSGLPRPSFQSRLPVRTPAVATAAAVPSASSRLSTTQGRFSHFRLPSMGKASVETGLFRPSTIGAGPKGPVKDPRPLSDRSYQMTLIRKLHSFLVETKYEGDVSINTLKCPKSRDFLCMFQHVIGIISPGEQFSGKFDEQIPALLKSLNYPFPVSSKALLSVGNPHTWSQMLGVFSWLIDLSTVMAASGPGFFSDDVNEFDDDDLKFQELMFEKVISCYELYFSGQLDLERGDLKMIVQKDTEENCEEVDRHKASLMAESEALEEEEMKLSNGPSLEKELKLKETYLADKRKYKEYISQLEDRKANRDLKMREEERKKKETRELEIAEFQEKKTKLEMCVANQKISAEEMQVFRAERSKLVGERESSKTQHETQLAELDRAQMRYNKVLSKFEQMTEQYNKEATTLGLIPATASNAMGRDLKLKFDLFTGSESHSEEEMMRIRKAVLPALNSVQENLMTATQQLSRQSQSLQEPCEKYESEISARTDIKERLDVESEALQNEIQSLEKEKAARVQMSRDHFASMLSEKQSLKSSSLASEVQHEEDKLRKLKIHLEKERAALLEQEAEDAKEVAGIQRLLEETAAELKHLLCTKAEALVEAQENLAVVPTAAQAIKKASKK